MYYLLLSLFIIFVTNYLDEKLDGVDLKANIFTVIEKNQIVLQSYAYHGSGEVYAFIFIFLTFIIFRYLRVNFLKNSKPIIYFLCLMSTVFPSVHLGVREPR